MQSVTHLSQIINIRKTEKRTVLIMKFKDLFIIRKISGLFLIKRIKKITVTRRDVRFELDLGNKTLTASYHFMGPDPRIQSITLNDFDFNACTDLIKTCMTTLPFREELPILGLPGAKYDALMRCNYSYKTLYYTNTYNNGFSLKTDTVYDEFVGLYDFLNSKFDMLQVFGNSGNTLKNVSVQNTVRR